MLTVAVPKRNKLPNIIVLTPKDGPHSYCTTIWHIMEVKKRAKNKMHEMHKKVNMIYKSCIKTLLLLC